MLRAFDFALASWPFCRWLEERRQRDGGQDSDDQDHHEELDQGEPPLPEWIRSLSFRSMLSPPL